jgi:hypothetical protein
MPFESIENDKLIWDKPGFLKKVKSDEDIILLAREDISILIFKAIRSYMLFFVLLIGKTIIDSFTDSILLLSAYDGIMFAVGTVIVVAFALEFHNYYLSIEIVTDERIIDIEQKSLFTREVNSMPIEKIQDATFRKEGFFSVIFDYGNVIIRSSGESNIGNRDGIEGFVFENVPKPAEIAHLINEIYHKQKASEHEERIKQEVKYLEKVRKDRLIGMARNSSVEANRKPNQSSVVKSAQNPVQNPTGKNNNLGQNASIAKSSPSSLENLKAGAKKELEN